MQYSIIYTNIYIYIITKSSTITIIDHQYVIAHHVPK